MLLDPSEELFSVPSFESSSAEEPSRAISLSYPVRLKRKVDPNFET
jgi:hypothetical protein